MKTVVFAYHNIGCIGLQALQKAGFNIQAVFTHIDNPKENIFFNSVAHITANMKLPIFAPNNINHFLWVQKIKQIEPDIIFSFYYRNILSEEILSIPKKGAFNLHASLLPKYRGRAPINWVIVNNEKQTGITLHKMINKIDAGDIVAQQRILINPKDTSLTLHNKICKATKKLLDTTLLLIKNNNYPLIPQNEDSATYFGYRQIHDGLINWKKTAIEINSLIRAVTIPYPGAFTYIGNNKMIIWNSRIIKKKHNKQPGTIISINPFQIACGQDIIQVITGQDNSHLYSEGIHLASEMKITPNMCIKNQFKKITYHKRILILGVNGFIGNHLTERLLIDGNYDVYGLDISSNDISRFINNQQFHFIEGDISIHTEWIEYLIKKCDIILPLVAIATPIEYIRNPLKVFELDFEENLKIVRYCVKYNKRIIFPSTSEVYGMCNDENFNEDTSNLIVGPVNKQRWIYSVSKQLLDRVIWAYGIKEKLQFTLFRPFNWVGPRLDTLNSARIGSSRVITQLILNLVEGTPIQLIDGGFQKRCFTDIKDGIEALFRIIENKNDQCDKKIINIGNPNNEINIIQLANMLINSFEQHKLRKYFPPFAGIKNIESNIYYGQGYQDIKYRKPSIKNANYLLNWQPKININETINNTLDFFLNAAAKE